MYDINLIISKTYDEAREVAKEQGFGPNEWVFAYTPSTIEGIHNVDVYFGGEWYNHPFIQQIMPILEGGQNIRFHTLDEVNNVAKRMKAMGSKNKMF